MGAAAWGGRWHFTVLDVRFYCSVADVDLACYDVGDKAGAVFSHQFYLATGAGYGCIYVPCQFVKVLDYVHLLVERGYRHVYVGVFFRVYVLDGRDYR